MSNTATHSTEGPGLTQSENFRNLVAACAGIVVFGLAFGMTYPLLSLILEQRSVSVELIGWNSAMMPIGIILVSPLIPKFTRRYGAKRVAIVAAIASALLMPTYMLFPSVGSWFLIRLLQGMSISVLFVLSEAWIVGSARKENRGKVVAIYSSVLSASFAAGPALIGVTGIDGWTPFVIGSVVLMLGTLPQFLISDAPSEETPEGTASGTLSFMPKAPMLLCCVAGFAVLDAATLSLLPVYGIRYGLDLPTATLMLTALIAGNVLLQLPIGWLADRYPRRPVLWGCALTTAVLLMLLPWSMHTVWMWPILLVGGTTGYGVYTVSLTDLGDRFSGQELIDGSAAFSSMWGAGALLGSIMGGASMSRFGPDGLPYSLALVYAFLVAGLILRKPARKKPVA